MLAKFVENRSGFSPIDYACGDKTFWKWLLKYCSPVTQHYYVLESQLGLVIGKNGANIDTLLAKFATEIIVPLKAQRDPNSKFVKIEFLARKREHIEKTKHHIETTGKERIVLSVEEPSSVATPTPQSADAHMVRNRT